MVIYSLICFLLGEGIKTDSWYYLVLNVQGLPHLESDGIDLVFDFWIWGKVMKSFEFLLFILKWIPQKFFCLTVFWHGRGKYEIMQYNNVCEKCSESHDAPYKCDLWLANNLWNSFWGDAMSLWLPLLLFSSEDVTHKSTGNIEAFCSIHWFPHERAELEVFLVENEVYSTWTGLRVGDALFTEGFSQSFRATKENSYSGVRVLTCDCLEFIIPVGPSIQSLLF